MHRTSFNVGNNLLLCNIAFKSEVTWITGGPVTQWTHQSRAKMNHENVKEFFKTSCHVMLCRIVSRFTLQP